MKEFADKQRQVAEAGAEIERVNQRSNALLKQKAAIQVCGETALRLWVAVTMFML
jgi:hypothetical protein